LLGTLVIEKQEGPRCLRARARVETPSHDPCILSPESRYRGTENQLYRIEIHEGGTATAAKDQATFKWSRENGSIVFAISSLQGSTATVETLGPDGRRGLKEGDWVEIADDYSDLRFAPRRLLEVDTVDPVSLKVTLLVPAGTELPVFDEASTTHPLLRRWDQDSDVLPVQEGKWIDLEDGVQVYFEPGGTYRTGDYWLVPARTAVGDQ
jgi:dipeptidyl aminopeptidase/acylaminoacyl peptidase